MFIFILINFILNSVNLGIGRGVSGLPCSNYLLSYQTSISTYMAIPDLFVHAIMTCVSASHRETDLGGCPAVSVAGPHQGEEVEAKERAQQCQHHVVLVHGGKQLCCARYVHVVRHHKEVGPEQSQVVTQAMRLPRGGLGTHLRQRDHISVQEVGKQHVHHFILVSTYMAAVSAPLLHTNAPVHAFGQVGRDLQCHVWFPSGIESDIKVPDSCGLL